MVWYNSEGITNILSLAWVQTKYRITYDSEDGNEFVVHSESCPRFIMTMPGLYYYDMAKRYDHENVLVGDGIVTVKKNKENYSVRDVIRAKEARKLQKTYEMSLRVP